MRSCSARLKNQKGSMLVMALILLLFFVVTGLTLTRSLSMNTRQLITTTRRDDAYFIAEAAHSIAYKEWARPDDSTGASAHMHGSTPPAPLQFTLDGHNVTVTLEDIVR